MTNPLKQKCAEGVRGDAVMVGGTLYCSDARRGDIQMLSFLSYARKMGLAAAKFVPAEEFRRKYLCQAPGALTDASDVQQYAIRMFRDAYERRATDIHLAYYGTYGLIRLRCLGMLKDYAKLPGEFVISLIQSMYNTFAESCNTVNFTAKQLQDARISKAAYFRGTDIHSVRVHSAPIESAEAADLETDGNGTLMVLRLLYDGSGAQGHATLGERLLALGYDQRDVGTIKGFVERTGLVVIAGPTGHGKTTLLTNIMDAMAQDHPEKCYLSIEDPPEYPLHGVYQVMVNTGHDSLGDSRARGQRYTEAIAGALRSDPDVLMVGEIRYPEAAKTTLEAAMTGHGTFVTLHANRATAIIPRLENLLDEAGSKHSLDNLCDPGIMAGLIYQRLVPTLCPHCKVPLKDLLGSAADREYLDDVLPPATRKRLLAVVGDIDGVYVRGRGCQECDFRGLAGQTVAAEVIPTDETFLYYMRHRETEKANDYWMAHLQGRTFVQHALGKIGQGLLDPYLTEQRLNVPLDFKGYGEPKA